MKILITGGAGFIGSHLSGRLIQQGHHVVILDNLFTGDLANLAEFRSTSRFEFMRHDVTFPFFVPVDRIYHLACPASPVHYQQNPVKTLRANFLGTLHSLEAARENRCRLLLASTSEVYGDPLEHPQTESYWGNVNPIGIRACYDEGKRSAEALMVAFQQEGADIRIARIFNTYGPKMQFDDGRAVSNFIVHALREENLLVHGSGLHTRSFCYVDDLVTGLITLMERPSFDGPINLGNPSEISVLSLAEQILELTESRSRITFGPLVEDDPKRRQPDIRKAQALLDFSPRISLREGLQRTIKDFKERLIEA